MDCSFREITTPRLILRRFRPEDAPTLLAYRGDPEVARFQSWQARDLESVRAFIAGQQHEEPGEPGPGFQFALELRASGEHVGDCFFRLIDYDPRQGEIGYTLARAHWGQGLAAEAVSALLGFAFGALGLHRVIAIVDCENAPSITLLERLGFRREGHFRQSLARDGAWRDEFQYAMLHQEWELSAQRRAPNQ